MKPTTDPWGARERILAAAIIILAILLAFIAVARADAAGPTITVRGAVEVVQPTTRTPIWYVAVRLDNCRIATAHIWSLRTGGPFRIGQRVTVTGIPDAYNDIFDARIK
jgi:hypothetical protein